MHKNKIGYLVLIVLLFVMGACTMPDEESSLGSIQTSVAQTVVVQSTLDAEREAYVDKTATPTVFYATPDYTATYAPTATEPVPCNLAGFVMDVTIPDDTLVSKGQIFTKTWKLQNIGSCAWTPAYQLIFMSGDQMNAALQSSFTSIVVEPGEMIDVSVQMTAPMASGQYQANFMLADENGKLFSFENKSAFYAKISVPVVLDGNETATPNITPTTAIQTMVVTSTSAAQATVMGNLKTVSISPTLANTMNNDYFNNSFNFGDLSSNDGAIGFAQFNLSQLPAGADIQSVTLKIPSYTISGNPFSALGCMRVYVGFYYPLNTDDYSYATLGASGRACGAGELTGVALNPDLLQSYFDAGSSAIDLKLMFNELQTNGDGAADLVRTSPGDVRLVIQYEE